MPMDMNVNFTERIRNDRSDICPVCSIRIMFDVLSDNSDIRDKDIGEVASVLIFRMGLNARLTWN